MAPSPSGRHAELAKKLSSARPDPRGRQVEADREGLAAFVRPFVLKAGDCWTAEGDHNAPRFRVQNQDNAS
jgi:hypothetical protein